jgi:hypothetical protein
MINRFNQIYYQKELRYFKPLVYKEKVDKLVWLNTISYSLLGYLAGVFAASPAGWHPVKAGQALPKIASKAIY